MRLRTRAASLALALLSSSAAARSSPPPPMAFAAAPHGGGAPLPPDALDALRRKNASRKRFGVPPMTPEEFVRMEEEVRAMDAVNKERAVLLAESLARERREREQQKEGGFLSGIFGGVLKDGCESNFDCERPMVCCDVGLKKMCCSSGLGIVDGIPVERYQRGVLRVPLPNDNVDY